MGMNSLTRKFDLFYVAIVAVLSIWALLVLYPFYNALLVSVTPLKEYTLSPFLIYPKSITLSAYQYILSSGRIFVGYKTTLAILFLGLPYNMLLSVLTAYALSKNKFPGKNGIIFFIIFTMFFNGGLIPLYLVVKTLGIMNTIWSVVLPYGINTFYMLIIKNYFETLPAEIEESAKIDGAGIFTTIFKIVLPLSTPIIATFVLFYAVDRWNEWFYPMLFLSKPNLIPLQVILRNILVENQAETLYAAGSSLRKEVYAKSIKMAAVVITMAPIMCVYPFLQRYFVKGLLLGAVKS